MLKKCIICQDEFKTPNTKRGRNKKTCSKSCSSKLGANNSYIYKNCSICSKSVKTRSSNMRPYCKDCSTIRYSKQKVCVICDRTFNTGRHDGSTCSKVCASKLGSKKIVTINCAFCGKEFERASSTYVEGRRHFCSKACNSNQFSIENPTRYGGTWKRRRKEILIRDNQKCLLCDNLYNLQVHHFKKILTFSNPDDAHYNENVGTFCEECHKKIENKYESLTEFKKRYSLNIRKSV